MTIIPHSGIQCAGEFPACSHHDEFLHCGKLGTTIPGRFVGSDRTQELAII